MSVFCCEMWHMEKCMEKVGAKSTKLYTLGCFGWICQDIGENVADLLFGDGGDSSSCKILICASTLILNLITRKLHRLLPH